MLHYSTVLIFMFKKKISANSSFPWTRGNNNLEIWMEFWMSLKFLVDLFF